MPSNLLTRKVTVTPPRPRPRRLQLTSTTTPPKKKQKQPQRAAITLLPELLEHCVSFVEPEDTKTRQAVCRTSIFLNRVATPVLYRNLYVNHTLVKGCEYPSRLQSLCRTLMDKPSLARLPTSLTLWLWPREFSSESRRLLDEGRFWNIVRERTNFEDDTYERFREDISDTVVTVDDEPWLLLLFALCSNLRSLTLTAKTKMIHSMQHLDALLRIEDEARASNPTHESCLLRIEDVTLKDSVLGSETTVEDIAYFLLLPRLRSLSVNSFEPCLDDVVVNGPLSTLEKLKISDCRRQIGDLRGLLWRCRNLQELDIEQDTREDAHRSFEWPILGDALRASCPRLKTLRLDDWPRWPEGVSNHLKWREMDSEGVNYEYFESLEENYIDLAHEHLSGLGDLRTLTELTSLTITENALRGRIGSPYRADAEDGRQEEEDDEEDEDERDDRDEHQIGEETREALPSLSDLLPPSLKHLTLICEDAYIHDKQELLQDPFVVQLDEFLILNCTKTYWYSKTGGEGGIDPASPDQQRRREREVWRAGPRPYRDPFE